jgi:phage/plasmid-associated DNA primase
MDESVQRELETLKGMVLTWKRSYLEWASSDGGSEFLVHEFLDEIETHVYPYTKRLYECEYLSQAEVDGFLDFCYQQVEELRDFVRGEQPPNNF